MILCPFKFKFCAVARNLRNADKRHSAGDNLHGRSRPCRHDGVVPRTRVDWRRLVREGVPGPAQEQQKGKFILASPSPPSSDECGLQLVALKVISTRGKTARELEALSREIQIMSSLSHPHIIQLYDWHQTDTQVNPASEGKGGMEGGNGGREGATYSSATLAYTSHILELQK